MGEPLRCAKSPVVVHFRSFARVGMNGAAGAGLHAGAPSFNRRVDFGRRRRVLLHKALMEATRVEPSNPFVKRKEVHFRHLPGRFPVAKRGALAQFVMQPYVEEVPSRPINDNAVAEDDRVVPLPYQSCAWAQNARVARQEGKCARSRTNTQSPREPMCVWGGRLASVARLVQQDARWVAARPTVGRGAPHGGSRRAPHRQRKR